MDDAEPDLDLLAELVTSIDSRTDMVLESLFTLNESETSKADANKIRTAVLAILGANKMLRDVLGISEDRRAVQKAESPRAIDVGNVNKNEALEDDEGEEKELGDEGLEREFKAKEEETKRYSVKDSLSASINLERLVFAVGPLGASDIVEAGLANNSDEALSMMSVLVESHKASWTTIADVRAIIAVR